MDLFKSNRSLKRRKNIVRVHFDKCALCCLTVRDYAYMDIFKKVCGKFGETIWNKYICINKTNIYAFNL